MNTGILLDTHVYLWWLVGSPRLGAKTVNAIRTTPIVLVSAASAWECAIKENLGKLTMPEDYTFMETLLATGFDDLPVSIWHAQGVRNLPNHHKDPFDRILIAQAIYENLTLVTVDEQIRAYDAPVLWGSE